MTKETCKIQYEIAKEQGNKEGMDGWKNRFIAHGGDIKELGEEKKKQ